MKINLKNAWFSCIFLLLFFVTCLDTLSSISIIQFFLKHVDEFIVILLYIYVLSRLKYLSKQKKYILLVWNCFIFLGIISSIVFRYQTLYATFVDCVLIVNKFMIGYLAAFIYASFYSGKISERIYQVVKWITIILFLLAIHDLIMTPFFEVADYRYGIYSLKLMFGHPTYLAAAGTTLLVYWGNYNKNRNNIWYMIMSSLLVTATMRGKAVAFVVVYWMLYMFIFVIKSRKYLILIGCGGISALAVGINQIKDYFFAASYSPRLIMLKDSISLATKHFPIGTGYGTFGSSMAADNYSILYDQLGYENYWGMGSTDNLFLSDGFWPTIIAQFGYIGLILFVLVVCLLFRQSIDVVRLDRYAGFAMLMIMINMVINSLAESAFFNPTALLLFIMFGIYEAETRYK